ncbi:DUF1569 domain-containing protein [Psychroserpens luteolus]|uniref:DUF1569 domain-containing protein n=1 Tax=Psychroserpens luteolus TaxID=2855840 RepID=UPI001E5416BC|nr:DUF1569 domain-containing protein [Psychroserpens luteolus]MCD2260489.1 DUF1569 domain-containing protein [Psychroserpens luteolus]
MKSIFTTEAHTEILNRIEQLDGQSQAKWGKMNAGQMAWHCQGPLNIILEKNDYGMKPSWFAKLFFKKSLYNDKPWRKGLPTAKFLKTKEDKDFNAEKATLVELINELHNQRDKSEWNPHPAFGHFTADQWGQMQYKHLDHHLKQFGV